MDTRRVQDIFLKLDATIDNTAPMLHFDSSFQLLVSVILSAQTTDAQVNRVTPELFSRYPSPASLAISELDALEQIVHSTGFYRRKAMHIRDAAAALVERYNGEVPNTIDELVTIPGVGRKSANVIVGACFGAPAIIVDTHFMRVTKRLGFTQSTDPAKIECELRKLVPENRQYVFSMLINRHGRATCTARKPTCDACVIRCFCTWPDRQLKPGEPNGANG